MGTYLNFNTIKNYQYPLSLGVTLEEGKKISSKDKSKAQKSRKKESKHQMETPEVVIRDGRTPEKRFSVEEVEVKQVKTSDIPIRDPKTLEKRSSEEQMEIPEGAIRDLETLEKRCSIEPVQTEQAKTPDITIRDAYIPEKRFSKGKRKVKNLAEDLRDVPARSEKSS